MNWQKWIGAAACVLLIVACFMHWAYYPGIQKYFTGFDSKVFYNGKWAHYYGRRGILLSAFGIICFCCHLLKYRWAKITNLVASALCLAYAAGSYSTFTSSYDGYTPDKSFGLFLMLGASIINLVAAAFVKERITPGTD